jgi:maltose alpha-D-glucosyltransferase / alpha-amylase
MPQRRRPPARAKASGNILWYKDAVIYELHVRSFQDSTGNGIGDFVGLTRRLPYLQDLGVTALWLLPFYPSPLRDDGYDIADYEGVHPDYGTIDDFRRFLDEAHRLGLRIITELVVNHTSDQHGWFQRARTAPPGSIERDFYVWSDSPDRYRGARIIFQDFERSNWSWDPIAQAYYWHRFYSHQPDLNYDNPAVFEAIVRVLDHWFSLGVDGLRLDAVPYLVEREGTASENLRETHAIVKRLRAHVDRTFENRIFIAEANQWPEDAAAYFGEGDESHMIFHFPLMPRLFMAIRQEDRLPIVDILAQTPEPPPSGQWALFLRNHDELTLEMVTEEERLYMYHVYAAEAHARLNLGIRRRLAPLLGNHRRRIELMNALLFSLHGTPVLYYGDEIGMGDNVYLGDRNGVRTPMQWSGDRNAGFSDAPPQRLFLPLIVDDEYHYHAVHVAQQLANPHSLLWWMKRLIALRKRYQAFGRGDLTMVECANPRVLAFVRTWGEQQILVVANLSRFVQHAGLELREVQGRVPVELFGRTRFPPVEGASYPLTLGPHAFLWFELADAEGQTRGSALPKIEVEDSWEDVFNVRGRGDLEDILPAYLERGTAWNLGGRAVLSVRVESALPLGGRHERRWICVLRVTLTAGEPERYLLPLGCRPAKRRTRPGADVVARLTVRRRPGARYELFDAAEDPAMAAALVREISGNGAAPDARGLDVVLADGARPLPDGDQALRPLQRVRPGSNAVFAVGRRTVLKLFRRIEAGPNPEIEVRAHLQRVGFPHTPPLLAAFRASRDGVQPPDGVWFGILQASVPNDGEAWSHAVRAARAGLRAAGRRSEMPPLIDSIVPMSAWDSLVDPAIAELTVSYAPIVERLGRRVAELHKALVAAPDEPAFAPEPPTALSRRSAYQRMRTLALSVLDDLRQRLPGLNPALRDIAESVLGRRADVLERLHRLLEGPFNSPRIRCHGNLHLGQVLHAGDELVIIDFDGEPGRPLYERRLKRAPLQDVATMVRSFHYAAHAAVNELYVAERAERHEPSQDAARLRWMRAWQLRVSAIFVDAYSREVAGSGLLPSDPDEARTLFETYLLERALYEIGFELNHRPEWLAAPLLDLPYLLAPPRTTWLPATDLEDVDAPPGPSVPSRRPRRRARRAGSSRLPS